MNIDELLKSILMIGVKIGKENPLTIPDKLTEKGLEIIKIANHGKNPLDDVIDRNIRKENMRLQAENNRLREVIKRVDEQIHRIKDCPRNTTAFWQIESAKIGLNEALNGESEEK